MRRFITFWVSLAACGVVVAGPPDYRKLTVASASTNAAAATTDIATDTMVVNGYLDVVFIDTTFSYTSPTVTVVVATSGSTGGLPARTLYTKTLSADARVSVRRIPVNSAGTTLTYPGVKVPLISDILTLSAYANNSTNLCSVTAYVTYTPEP